MKNLPIILIGLLFACEQNNCNRNWSYARLSLLDYRNYRITDLNAELDSAFTIQNPNFISIRYLTDSTLKQLSDMTDELIANAGGIKPTGSLYEYMYPMNQENVHNYFFEENQYRPFAAEQIIKLLEKFDNDPRTESKIAWGMNHMFYLASEDEKPLHIETFEPLNLGEAVQMMITIQRLVALAEYEHLISWMKK